MKQTNMYIVEREAALHISELFKSSIKKEEKLPETRARQSVVEPRFIELPRCSSCNKVIHPRDTSVVAFVCPHCGKAIIIRCSKCREIGNIAKCPVCGYEYP